MKFIDLFSGIGGFRLALEKNKCECVFSSEIDKYARETYKLNFNDYPYGDITKIHHDDIPDHDILCAGFPCQPFSQAGKRLGFNDARGTLFFEVLKILKYKQPKAFILENVSGIVNHDNGKTLEVIVNSLKDAGYKISWKVLNSKHYGVPQNRNRWYCVGVLKKFNIIDIEEVFPKSSKLSYYLDEVISPIKSNHYQISEVAIKNVKKHIDTFKKKNKNNEHIIIANNIRPSKVSFSANGISPCLTAKMGTGGNNVPVIVKWKRKLTEKECLKLMGFPDDFIIKENYSQSYKQIGNSIVVPIVEKISNNLIERLNNIK
ncbi:MULTISPECIES: DNA cytosine methyltransferase [Staphylococcus]|uniref:DNA cytosine methyltransferase n=1 Tax=Staphylococcus TaxID=1279 RepID=UPI0008A4BE42|nr:MULTISPECIES: DNA (cytosine-5-)-methyltransferase [Staphylococcus]MCO6332047.1 DNA (cytosine-5-)-methyltransferase [Staphylococcus epidermidis]OFR27515.1 DNA cytosine methyltransferase [Staphylococcus sp. HMSC065D05]